MNRFLGSRLYYVLAFLIGALCAGFAPHQSLRQIPLIGMGIGVTFYLNLFQSYRDYRKQIKFKHKQPKGYFVLILPSSEWYKFLRYISSFLVGLGLVGLFSYL